MKICTTCGAEWPDDTKFCPSDGSALKAAGGEGSLVGGVLQSYHIIKKLGEGGMGAVYLGEHVKMGRKSAIKVMTQSLAQDTDAIARFNREAANAASINHVNVCAIYDFGETSDGTIFLAMEYIEGEALTDLIKREGPLDLKRAGAILEQTGDALQAAHELGIVHRDLKPDNIMIAKARSGSDLVKVVDFGIAKAMGGEEGQNVTRTGLVVGTPEYMSPEQLSGDKLDGRSDEYSLALVFFRMITGVLPFQADSAQEVMIKRLTDDPTRLNEALQGGNFPPKLQLVMDRAMERMPSDRYASADEFAREAVEAIANAATTAPPQPVDTEGATQLLDTGATGGAVTEQLKKTRLSEAQATVAMGEVADADGAAEATRADQDAASAATEILSEPAAATPETPMPRTAPDAPKRKKPVLAIAASVVVVGITGGVAAVAFGGGGNDEPGPAPDTSLVAIVPPDGGEGSNTQPGGQAETPPGGEQQRPTGGEQQTQQGAEQERPSEDTPADTEDDPVVSSRPNADSMAIELRIDAIIEGILEPETVVQARSDAQGVFADPAASAIQKAHVAYQLAVSYDPLMDFNGSSQVMACRWIDRALEHAPANTRYLEFQQGKCNL